MRRLAALALVLLLPSVARADWPERFGPVVVGDDVASVRVSLFSQLQLRGRTSSDEDFAFDLRVRRIRPILRGRFLDGRITSTLHLEVTPTAPELIDAWVDAEILPALRLRVGQMKAPFTRYFQRSLIELAVDWPLTVRWLGGERQLGLMAHGEDPASGFGYAAGVFGGQNRRSAFARELARVYGERLENPSSFTDPAPSDPLHPEVFARIDHRGEEGPFEHVASISAAWDTGPVARRDYALRVAPELELHAGPVGVHVIGYLGFVEIAGAVEPAVVGVHSEVAWRADRHLEMVLRYGRVHVLPALVRDATEQMHPETAPPHAHHELSLAANVLIVGRSLAWQTDASWLRAERPGDARDDLRVRTQLQLAF